MDSFLFIAIPNSPELQDAPAFVTFLTAGFPGRDDTAPLMLAMQSGGADIIELGVPFSDPVADGPVIQAANTVRSGIPPYLGTELTSPILGCLAQRGRLCDSPRPAERRPEARAHCASSSHGYELLHLIRPIPVNSHLTLSRILQPHSSLRG